MVRSLGAALQTGIGRGDSSGGERVWGMRRVRSWKEVIAVRSDVRPKRRLIWSIPVLIAYMNRDAEIREAIASYLFTFIVTSGAFTPHGVTSKNGRPQSGLVYPRSGYAHAQMEGTKIREANTACRQCLLHGHRFG